MKNRLKIFIAILGIFITASCERVLIETNNQNTPIENFNLLWDELDKGYVYFDYKRINWDSIRTIYEPQINNSMTDEELFEVLATMLETLRDGHVSIRQNIINNRAYDVTQGFEANFNKEFVINKYLIPNNMDTTTWIRHCFLDNDIGYLYYSTFTNEISREGMDEILTKYADTKGLIIDVRDNFGGDASNISRLIERFVANPVVVGFSQEKTGEKHSDLSNPEEIIVSPEGLSYTKPIIVLSNRGCYSACNSFVSYMSLFPNVTIMGDISGGGGGLPVANQLWNGWFFTYSSTIGSLPDGFIFENGIEPDIKVNTDNSFEIMGIDNIIEQAILELQ